MLRPDPGSEEQRPYGRRPPETAAFRLSDTQRVLC
jgi:hypothetical protein